MLDIIFISIFGLFIFSTFFYKIKVVKDYLQPFLFYSVIAFLAYFSLFTEEPFYLGKMGGHVSPKDYPILCRSIGLIEALISIYGFVQIVRRIKTKKDDVKQ